MTINQAARLYDKSAQSLKYWIRVKGFAPEEAVAKAVVNDPDRKHGDHRRKRL